MDITNQQLKYIKDYAEQRAINRFTTAKISVDMSNVINGSSKADMEGIVTHLKDKIGRRNVSSSGRGALECID